MKPLYRKILQYCLALVLILVIASLAYIRHLGIWNIVFPSHKHETVAPEIPLTIEQPAILLFTKTNSFRHVKGIAAGASFFKSLAPERGWSVFHTENSAVFNAEDLSRFDVVMFHNASGDTLSKDQQQEFQHWLQAGGGWVGTHSAGDGSHQDWPWYVENLIGAKFTAHIMGPQFQLAQVRNELPEHPAMAGLPAHWQHEEEWYSWEESPNRQDFVVLATIDEDSYTPVQKLFDSEVDLRMGYHPVVWSRCIDKGRAIYSAMGHAAEAYDNAEHRQLLANAIAWAMDIQSCKEISP